MFEFVQNQPATLVQPLGESCQKSYDTNKFATFMTNARVLIQAGEFELSFHLLREALNLNSKHPEALKAMFECVNHRKDFAVARKIAETLIQCQPNLGSHTIYGNFLYQQNQFAEAKEVYLSALKFSEYSAENLFDIYKNLGNIFVREQDLDSAEEFYNKALAIRADSDVVLTNLATLYIQYKDNSKALQLFRQAVEINSSNDKAWVGVALGHQALGDFELAQANLLKAVDIDASNRTAVQLLVNIYVQTKELDKAQKCLERYLHIKGDDVEISLLLIHVYSLAQKYDLAQLELERALLWNPERADLLVIENKLKELQ